MTNGDVIRRMSDEELARYLSRIAGTYCDYEDPSEKEYAFYSWWLKSKYAPSGVRKVKPRRVKCLKQYGQK